MAEFRRAEAPPRKDEEIMPEGLQCFIWFCLGIQFPRFVELVVSWLQ